MKITERTTWKRKDGAREGWIKFATATKVKICFTESSLQNYKVHDREDFVRLYELKPIK